MSEIHYTMSRNQKPTKDQIDMIDKAGKLQQNQLNEGKYSEVYGDCPKTDPLSNPKRYEAMMKAVAERNQRVENLLKRA